MSLKYVWTSVLFLMIVGAAQSVAAEDLYFDDVPLRDGVSADIHVRVFQADEFPSSSQCPSQNSGKTVFAIHGVAHTAESWAPLAQEMMSNHHRGPKICRVIAIDLPGHGLSGLPEGAVLGELVLEDYAVAIIETLARLEAQGVRPNAIVGHSMGGILVQLVQKSLIEEGTSLARRFRIRAALLLATSAPAELPGEALEVDLEPFIAFDPTLGVYLDVPSPVWLALFFSREDGVLVAGTPDVAVVESDYNSIESLEALLQVVGLSALGAPSIPAGIFATRYGTRLGMQANSADPFGRPDNQAAIYEHLTGDSRLRRFFVYDSANAVHDSHVANPAAIIDAIGGTRGLN